MKTYLLLALILATFVNLVLDSVASVAPLATKAGMLVWITLLLFSLLAIRNYFNSMDWQIVKNTYRLQRQIKDNENTIQQYRRRIQKVNEQLQYKSIMIDRKILLITEENIFQWKKRISYFQQRNSLLRQRIQQLARHREEIVLLKTMLRIVRTEPSKPEHIRPIEQQLHHIDNKLRSLSIHDHKTIENKKSRPNVGE